MIVPQVPSWSATDVTNAQTLTSPDSTLATNIKLVLSNQTTIMNTFISQNLAAYSNNWTNSIANQYDGLCLMTAATIKDQTSIGICVEQGVAGPYRCWDLKYDSTQTPKIVASFSNSLAYSSTYSETLASQDPTYTVLTSLYDKTCGDASGATYVGSGVGNCFGISAGTPYANAGSNWVDINAYIFSPQTGANAATLGYRWNADGTTIIARVILNNGGNK